MTVSKLYDKQNIFEVPSPQLSKLLPVQLLYCLTQSLIFQSFSKENQIKFVSKRKKKYESPLVTDKNLHGYPTNWYRNKNTHSYLWIYSFAVSCQWSLRRRIIAFYLFIYFYFHFLSRWPIPGCIETVCQYAQALEQKKKKKKMQ